MDFGDTGVFSLHIYKKHAHSPCFPPIHAHSIWLGSSDSDPPEFTDKYRKEKRERRNTVSPRAGV